MFLRIFEISGLYIILIAISPLIILFCKNDTLKNYAVFNNIFGIVIILFSSGLRYFDSRNTSFIFAVGIINIFLIVYILEHRFP